MDLSYIKCYICKQKNTMPISVTKSQKTSSSLGNFYVNNWQENIRKIQTGTLYLVSRHFQGLDSGLTQFKKCS